MLCITVNAQTTSTGALTGVMLDPSGAALPDMVVSIVNENTGRSKSAISNRQGRFSFLLLTPGMYEVTIETTKSDGMTGHATVNVTVTETAYLELHLYPATVFQSINVSANAATVRTDTSALGNVVNETAASSLPLATRNFAQIASLSPGVSTGVYNAGELGLGGTALSQIAKSNDGTYTERVRTTTISKLTELA
jgi:hypothetical protein